ncbi:glycoside hydrolase family 35 protein [Hypoxylon trugodes]|uniref:glycoside hydrolase family 35 protein n=1 Tax=Hypoxylon trugodes TaxID=326681 RepID=UPI00218EF98E|nr:glycoside hydrolase family 35 protein [Hypoxylon trugodes]KAI1390475.1 glycoside hydrolase family 35 protein [Hypoxylon trugodes]
MDGLWGLIIGVWLLYSHSFLISAQSLQSQAILTTRGNSTALQNIVEWDEYSIYVRGERVMFLSGEVHPFRLPSPGLWLDVFQKVKAMGFTGVSFYVMWGLIEGEPGHIRAEGVFALEEFFQAASEAGIYLLARPGPYINAEVSGGGFPGWIARSQGEIRSDDPDFENATKTYLSSIGSIISKAQITNGGPVILVQPENEYSFCTDYTSPGGINACLHKGYMAWVEDELRNAGIVVPFLSNDAVPLGSFAPGSGTGAVDIYGLDDYPFLWGGSCANPSNWSRGQFPLSMFNYTTHLAFSPETPFAVTEYQGGAPDPWGGVGSEQCSALINNEFARVFNKVLYSMRVSLLNFYMIFGGTNWGNLGHPDGYTSYDVGAAIKENRQLTREKYSELKLQGNFFRVSPSYLTTVPEDGSFAVYTNTSELVVTLLNGPGTKYYVIRQTNYTSLGMIQYNLTVNTSSGNITIPQLGGALSLHGRDSKIAVSDYPVGEVNLVYSSAEILSWKKYQTRTILILYGGAEENHEFAVPATLGCPTSSEGVSFRCELIQELVVVQWDVEDSSQILYFSGGFEIHLLWRNEAYNYWILDLPAPDPIGLYPAPVRNDSVDSSVIVKGGYLMRNASILDDSLYLVGDINTTTTIEVIASPITPKRILFNGEEIQITQLNHSRITGIIDYVPPTIELPDLTKLEWRYIDSLPELGPGFDDYGWSACVSPTTNNTRNLTTPFSLYASDYGYHSGSLLYRGQFITTGNESAFFLGSQGGSGFAHSVWLDSTFLGSWTGGPSSSYNQTFPFPSKFEMGERHVLNVLIDHMGLHENFEADGQGMREPRGILYYGLVGQPDPLVLSWIVTGNVGGEQYIDHSRGPLNEGGIWAERKGYHLPGAPTSKWEKRSPSQGLTSPGVGFFSTEFDLQIPLGYDVPISLRIGNSSYLNATQNFRVQIFINGWQFGKYVNNLGPQNRFVLPEGILNYNGTNYLALTLWSLDPSGDTVEDLALEVDGIIQSGYRKPYLVEGSSYSERGFG